MLITKQRSRTTPAQAESRIVAIRAIVELADDRDDLDAALLALRLLGTSDGELTAALVGTRTHGSSPSHGEQTTLPGCS
jgi:hypothetical protein